MRGGGAFDPGPILALNPSLFGVPQPPYLTLNGAGVAALENLGTAGGSWAQGTASAQPAHTTADGKHWAEFDGNDWLDIDLTSIRTVFLAVRVASASKQLSTWFSDDADINELRLVTGAGEEAPPDAWDWRLDGDKQVFVNGAEDTTFLPDVGHVVRCVFNTGKSTGIIGRADATLTNRYAFGGLYGLVGFAGTLDAGETALVESILASLLP